MTDEDRPPAGAKRARRNARAGKPPAFQFYHGDYLADEAVIGMTLAQVGAYSLLLAIHAREGSIPAEPERIARLVRCQGRSVAFRALWVWPLSSCFQSHPSEPGRLVQARMFDELKLAENRYLESVESGVLGGRKSAKLRLAIQGSGKGASTSASASSPSSTEAEKDMRNSPARTLPLALAGERVCRWTDGWTDGCAPGCLFRAFWQAVVRKKGKQMAWHHWHKRLKVSTELAEVIITTYARDVGEWHRSGREMATIPYASSWLHSAPWLDSPEAPTVAAAIEQLDEELEGV